MNTFTHYKVSSEELLQGFERGGGGECSVPVRSIWKVQVPLRVALFSWCVALGRVLTIDNFRRRAIIVMKRCYMCKKIGDVNHLFLHYHVVWK